MTDWRRKMSRYDELQSILEDIKEPKKSFILSLLKDFVWLEGQIDELRKYPRYIINANDPKQQKKLEVHNMLKDFQAQKNDIATKILRSLDKDTGQESALSKLLSEFNDE